MNFTALRSISRTFLRSTAATGRVSRASASRRTSRSSTVTRPLMLKITRSSSVTRRSILHVIPATLPDFLRSKPNATQPQKHGGEADVDSTVTRRRLVNLVNVVILVILVVILVTLVVASAKSESLLIDIQGFDPVIQRGRWNPQLRRRAGRTGDASSTLGRRHLDHLALAARLAALRRRRENNGGRGRGPRFPQEPQFVDSKHLARTQNHRPLDDVLQLPNVARPVVADQQVERFPADGVEMSAEPARVALHEILHQHRDIVFPRAEGWHFDQKYIQPVKQVLTETASRDRRGQVTICGCDEAYLHKDRLGAADALEFPLLQDAQECDLRIGQELADFIEEEGAAVGQFEASKPTLHRTGKGALLMAEQFRGDQRRCESRTIHAHERPARWRRAFVKGAGDGLLARALLTW